MHINVLPAHVQMHHVHEMPSRPEGETDFLDLPFQNAVILCVYARN